MSNLDKESNRDNQAAMIEQVTKMVYKDAVIKELEDLLKKAKHPLALVGSDFKDVVAVKDIEKRIKELKGE